MEVTTDTAEVVLMPRDPFQGYDQWKTASPYDDEPAVVVTLTCNGDKVDEDTVEFVNIEEDMQGRDLLTFVCPECGKEHTAYRLG